MKKIFFFFAIFAILNLNLFAQEAVQLTNTKNTEIIYTLSHPAHEVEAKSKDLQVKIEYDKKGNKVTKAIAMVKVTSFDSGNSSRDSHAMESIESTKYPTATFKSSSFAYDGDSLKIYGSITFHGVTKLLTINAKQSLSGNYLKITGRFGISLDHHNVERPKLLFVPTDEYLHFSFTADFNIK